VESDQEGIVTIEANESIIQINFDHETKSAAKFSLEDSVSSENTQSENQLTQGSEFFSDVAPEHANYHAIKALKEGGFINGYEDNSFKPDSPVLRVEALQMIHNAFEIDATGKLPNLSFSDIEQGAWYIDALKRAVKTGVIEGYNDGSLKPAQAINKVEYFKMLLKVNKVEEFDTNGQKSYNDTPTNEWFAWIAQVIKERNLIDSPDNLLKPDEFMTRAMVAESIYRMKYLIENNELSYQ